MKTPATLNNRFTDLLIDTCFIITPLLVIIDMVAPVAINGFVFNTFVSFLYFTFFESLWQKTPGKWVSGVKVVTYDGQKPTLGRIMIRSLARAIPFESFSFLLSRYPVGWHDALSKTMVVPQEYTVEDIVAIDRKALKQREQ